MKTIGRTKPKPDRTLVNESIASFDALKHIDAERAAEDEKLAPRERASFAEIVSLRRQLAVERARASAYAMGCDPRNPTRPVMTAFEREREFERILLSLKDLNAEARAKAIDQLIADTAGYVERRDGFQRSVESELAKSKPEYEPNTSYGHDPAVSLGKTVK